MRNYEKYYSFFSRHSDGDTRPDFSILFYPVITMEEGITHKGTHDRLLGERANDPALVARYSME